MEGIITCKVVLDPRFKTAVYERLGGFTPEIVDQIRKRCNDVYLAYRGQMEQGSDDGTSYNAAAEDEDTSMQHDPFMAKLFGLGPQGSSLGGSFQDRQELDEYLARPSEKGVDPLQWWKHQQALGEFPVLSKVAKDYLAIPGHMLLLRIL